MSHIHQRHQSSADRLFVLCLIVGFFPGVLAAATATFELRTTTDWNLDLDPAGDQLVLEVWMELTGTTDNMKGYSFFLDIAPADDGIIKFDTASYVDDSGLGAAVGGTDNTAQSGDFSRCGFDMFGPGVNFGQGAPERLGSFTVSPKTVGVVSYTFSSESLRSWSVTLAGSVPIATVTMITPHDITVNAPEPAATSIILMALAGLGRRRCRGPCRY